MMKFALILVIVTVLLPCILAFDIDHRPEKDVLGKWLEEQMVKGQLSNDRNNMKFYICIRMQLGCHFRHANVAVLLGSTDNLHFPTLSLVLQRREQAAILNKDYANNLGHRLRNGPKGADEASCILQIICIIFLIWLGGCEEDFGLSRNGKSG